MSRNAFRPKHIKRENLGSLDNAAARDSAALLVPTGSIIVKQNPRSDLGDLTELKTSIDGRGILNPLLVAQTASGIELLGGHRRLQCAKELGLTHVPCRVVKTEEPEVVKLLDNIMREALSPEDECVALKRLLPAFDGNKSALARALSKSPSYVTRALKVAEMVEAGLCAGAKLTKTALMELADSADPQATLAAALDRKKESIREARLDAKPDNGERRPNGPPAGARTVTEAVKLHETKAGGFSVKISFHPERTPDTARADIVRVLESLLSKLKART
jgi:ParB family chromosome partitioning protein